MTLLEQLTHNFVFTGSLPDDVPAFLNFHDCPKTAVHVADVAAEARKLAGLFGADADQAALAGWLHDVSAVFPSAQRANIARQLGVDVLPEEDIFPMIIHQKLSVVLAQGVFGIADEAVLSAIGCHTTLKANASLLDKVVFIADKIAWDQPGTPPYLDALLAQLDQSLDNAVRVYLHYLWDIRYNLKIIHPWMAEAYAEFSAK